MFILWINSSRKPKFTPQTVSFTLRCKELEQWFISMRIEKCFLGKESSGAKGWMQPHSLALPTIFFGDHLWQHLRMDLYSWGPSSWGTLTPPAMLKQNKGARLPRWTSGRQAVHLWEAISNKTIWNKNALGAKLSVRGKAPQSCYWHLIVGLQWPSCGPAWAAQTRAPPAGCDSQIHAGKQLCKLC